jgi:hypothetical protein
MSWQQQHTSRTNRTSSSRNQRALPSRARIGGRQRPLLCIGQNRITEEKQSPGDSLSLDRSCPRADQLRKNKDRERGRRCQKSNENHKGQVGNRRQSGGKIQKSLLSPWTEETRQRSEQSVRKSFSSRRENTRSDQRARETGTQTTDKIGPTARTKR